MQSLDVNSCCRILKTADTFKVKNFKKLRGMVDDGGLWESPSRVDTDDDVYTFETYDSYGGDDKDVDAFVV
jgi:hypothetical protein